MNQYIALAKLGEGAFSVVYKVKRKEDEKQYAMKKIRIMNLSQKEIANCLNEVRILASIQDPHILSYRDSFFDELTKTFCIVTQCLQGGDVFKMITRHKQSKKMIDQKTIWKVAYQSLKGLKSLHDMQILHRDIKSANIFLSKDQSVVKLADMNVSIVSSNGMAKTQTGTPYYASPQVWMEKPYSTKCDIWSLGCVLYEMASLRPPFMTHDLKSLKKAIISGVFKRIPGVYSADLQNFIRLCLKVDPKDRMSASHLLEHNLLKTNIIDQKSQSLQVSLNGSLSHKLLERILPPKKRQFRIIKDRLPQHRFEASSCQKISNNSSVYDAKNKQNIPNAPKTGKISKKDELPTLRPSSSLNQKQTKLKQLNQKLFLCDEKPPLPRRALRA